MDAKNRISRARASMVLTAPFYATLALGLKVEHRDAVGTMATDGTSLFFNAEFVDGLTDAELRGLMVHEMLHIANLHHVRQGTRVGEKWNCATDYAINAEVIAEGYTLPDDALLDQRYAGMSAEAIYNDLPDGSGGGGGGGSNFGGVLPAAHAHDKAALERATIDAKTKVIQAAQIAKKAGQSTGTSERLAGDAKAHGVDWRATLRRFVDASARVDYSWSRPNRRMLSQGFILPGKVPDGLGHLVVIIDTSGSVNAKALARFIAEIDGAVSDAMPDRVTVMDCDTEVRAMREFEPGEPIFTKCLGGGSTNMQPALDAVPYDASAVICFTDCIFYREPVAIQTPVLWARWGAYKGCPAWGELVEVPAS